jgi:hypothetical protein
MSDIKVLINGICQRYYDQDWQWCRENLNKDQIAHLFVNGIDYAMEAYAAQALAEREEDRWESDFNMLLNNNILVTVSPLDDWNEWGFLITLKDCFAPFADVVLPDFDNPFKTHNEAMIAGIRKAKEFLPTPPKE